MADDKAAPLPGRGADLPTRLISAAVLLALTGAAMALGGAVLDAFIFLVALIAFVEFVGLVLAATGSWPLRIAAIAAGAAYFGVAAAIMPPTSPAQVFDGLIVGAIFGPPIARPAKKAPVSVNTAMPITRISRKVPAPASIAAATPK